MLRRNSRGRSMERRNSVGRGRSRAGFMKPSRTSRRPLSRVAQRSGGGRVTRDNRRQKLLKSPTASKERINLESGTLLLIDQFMLANDIFLNELNSLKDASLEKREQLVREFGGEVVRLEPGEYKIARDPFKFYMAIYPEKGEFSEAELDKTMKPIGEVFVNTRCLALVDWELLNDFDFLNQYSSLWNSGKDKKCRDLIREAGGAVRYGFNRHGDELGVHVFREASRIYLWPINEPEESQEFLEETV
ncbi:MAG: hypothetical protein NZT61_03650 [Deltaproteobacteria bacterium]|nr:hypothetical protein [Deltaproteobacteria bacterium]